MKNQHLKLKVRNLRKRGKSIREIVKITGVPLSTASFWCRDIFLTKKQLERLISKQRSPSYPGRLRASLGLKRQRIQSTLCLRKEGINAIGRMTIRELFMTGIGLYWGEGYRRHESIGFTSSDAQIIKFIIKWFKRFLNAKSKDFSLRISINNLHRNRTKEIKRYWSSVTRIPLHQFTKTSLIKIGQKKKYESRDTYYGTLRILLRKSTSIHRKFLGWIEGVYRNV